MGGGAGGGPSIGARMRQSVSQVPGWGELPKLNLGAEGAGAGAGSRGGDADDEPDDDTPWFDFVQK